MNSDQLKETWTQEERITHIHGWNFSHIRDRYPEEDDLPRNFSEAI